MVLSAIYQIRVAFEIRDRFGMTLASFNAGRVGGYLREFTLLLN
jgi:hypothetical protein